jgi:prevent-host-death family protein
MQTWQMQDARAKLKDVYDAALDGEPQRITRHGKQPVVIVSEQAWQRASGTAEGFGALLVACPLRAKELPTRRPARIIRARTFG